MCHASTFIISISVILIYDFYEYLHVAKSLSSQDHQKLVTCHLTATALAHLAIVYLLLQFSTVHTLRY